MRYAKGFFIDLTGKVFGRLTVKCFSHLEPKHNHRYWLCKCSCGNERIIVAQSLKGGRTRSCGCLLREKAREQAKKRIKHGDSFVGKYIKEYSTWTGIKKRCYNAKCYAYKNYGARGIKVCDRWLHNYSAFLADMGRCPDGYSLDRIDVNGNYEPLNCRWATDKEQAGNTRRNVWLEYNGIKQIESDWARQFGINASLFVSWVKRKISMEDIHEKARQHCLKKKVKRNKVWLEHNGVKKIQADWVREWNYPRRNFLYWRRKGLSMQEIYNKSLENRLCMKSKS